MVLLCIPTCGVEAAQWTYHVAEVGIRASSLKCSRSVEVHYIGEEMRFLNIEDATKNGDYYNATRCVAKIARYQIIRDG